MATPVTITSALAELKLITKRLDRKKDFVRSFLWRQEIMTDPLERQGGSIEAIKRTLQAVGDLGERRVAIRRAIAKANAETILEIEGEKRSLADWLTWRREVAPYEKQLLTEMRNALEGARKDATAKGLRVVGQGEEATERRDIRVNIDELELHRDIEHLETVLGRLDGALQVANATTVVELSELKDEDPPTVEQINKLKA